MSQSRIDIIGQNGPTGEHYPADNYERLRQVLDAAYAQAAVGKGHKRHGQDTPFDKQPMQQISRLLSTPGGMAYQVIKKTQEAQRMPTDQAIFELYGVINYAAGMIIYLEDNA